MNIIVLFPYFFDLISSMNSSIDLSNIVGMMAAILTTAAFVPQVVKTWRSKSADDVSLVMFILFILGVFLWCIYGIEISALPVIIANVITFILDSLVSP